MYRILIVEDDAMMRKMLREGLHPGGFEVIECAEGGAALDLARKDKPDLVLLDMHLPDRWGAEVCKELKSDPATKHIAVVILTGEARTVENRVEGLELGADDYLFKPISLKVLRSRLSSILSVTAKPTRSQG